MKCIVLKYENSSQANGRYYILDTDTDTEMMKGISLYYLLLRYKHVQIASAGSYCIPSFYSCPTYNPKCVSVGDCLCGLQFDLYPLFRFRFRDYASKVGNYKAPPGPEGRGHGYPVDPAAAAAAAGAGTGGIPV